MEVETKKQEITGIINAPKFKHEEIEWLYSYDVLIGEEKLNALLALPRESLISDLELVLQDGIDRYGYFSDLVEEQFYEEEKMYFLIHAFYLLGELKAKSSLKSLYSLLSQSNEFIELYLGDFSTDMLWEPLYKIGDDNLDICKQFLLKPGIDTFSRAAITDLLVQIALHKPERRNEVLRCFQEVVNFYLKSSIDDNILDADFIALLICDIVTIGGSGLSTDIEKLFANKMVTLGVTGSWEVLKKEIRNEPDLGQIRTVLPISKRYIDISETWAGYNENEEDLVGSMEGFFEPELISNDPLIMEDYIPEMPVVRDAPKIGRNEPCPCGSGKKHKKCCLNV